MTSLSEIYGHEENLSKAIAESDSFEELLNICGVVPTEKAIFETRVDLGHDDHEGRIDIIQPTTAGIVIVEVQYGTSDNSHAKRLQNYATNFRKPAFVIWVAEKFRKDHAALFEQAKTPVLCATVSQSDDLLKLKKASPINWTKQSQAKRIKEAHSKFLELFPRLFRKGGRIDFVPMHRFFGGVKYQSLTSRRKRLYKDLYKKIVQRNKPIDFESNIMAVIEWYLAGLPKKTHFYLLKHPSFQQKKEEWMDEMACHWMLCNLNNDHPFLDFSYLYSMMDDLPRGRNHTDVYALEHSSRVSNLKARDFFNDEPWYEFSNEYDSSTVGPAGYFYNEYYYEQLSEWIEWQRCNWKKGDVVKDPNIHRWIPYEQ